MVIFEADGQIDISGSPAELNAIADAIEGLTFGAKFSIGADATVNSSPFNRCLAGLEARATDGPVRVALSGERVVVTGSAAMLRTFTSCFRFGEDAPRGRHCHHEWFEGNDDIAPDSLPLIVSVA